MKEDSRGKPIDKDTKELKLSELLESRTTSLVIFNPYIPCKTFEGRARPTKLSSDAQAKSTFSCDSSL